MLSSLASYLWGAAPEEDGAAQDTTAEPTTEPAPAASAHPARKAEGPPLKTRAADNEWVLVEKAHPRADINRKSSGKSKTADPILECSLGPLFQSFSPAVSDYVSPPHSSSSDSVDNWLDGSLCMSRGLGYHGSQTDSYHSHISDTAESDVSSLLERVVHPSMEESWLVTPPACFTAGSSSSRRMETSSMENLLIEHPSMSVYSHRGRQSSTGLDSEGSGSDMETPEANQAMTARAGGCRAGPARHEPPRRTSALAARVGLTQVQLVKSMQKSQQRHLYKNLSSTRITRSNAVREVRSQGNKRLRHHVQQPMRRSHVNKQY